MLAYVVNWCGYLVSLFSVHELLAYVLMLAYVFIAEYANMAVMSAVASIYVLILNTRLESGVDAG